MSPKQILAAYLLPGAAAVLLSLSGCDKLKTSGQASTMSLLQSGSSQVCIAPDVQKGLRNLIIPPPDQGGSADEQRFSQDAISTLDLSFDMTTLESVDKTINKAVCNTIAKVASSDGDQHSFPVTYQITPSAEQPGSFIINGEFDAVRAFVRDQVGNSVSHQIAAQAQEQEADAAERERQKLLATISPKWLVGSWIPSSDDASECGNGRAFVFHNDGSFTSLQTEGRWVLTTENLHIVAQGPTRPINVSGTITAADPLTFTLEDDNASPSEFRRCTRDEVANTGLPDTIAPAEPDQN